MRYPIPSNEPERLKEVERLRSGEWGFSDALDRLCALATRELGVPIALVTIIGEHDQHVAARRGLALSATTRESSFCTHTIIEGQPFVIEDAIEDPRFSDNPYVVGEPGIRAYAGVPLETAQNLRVGALCAIDLKPRHFTSDELAFLSDLGALAAFIIESHRTRLSLDDALARAEDMQRQLRRQAEELQHSNRELAEFAQVLSHDLKAPIRAVTAFLPEMLESVRHGDMKGAMEDYELVLKSADHMDALIDTLQDYCKVRYREPAVADVSMREALNDVLDILSPAIEERSAEIEADELPAVKGDKPQLVLLLQNLIGNALKFSEAQPRITITTEPLGGRHRFSVRDNGIGVGAKHLERIFKPFYRLHSSSSYPGAGLGLAICRKIVERHGGRIWAESEPGQGAVFHFTLPAARARGNGAG